MMVQVCDWHIFLSLRFFYLFVNNILCVPLILYENVAFCLLWFSGKVAVWFSTSREDRLAQHSHSQFSFLLTMKWENINNGIGQVNVLVHKSRCRCNCKLILKMHAIWHPANKHVSTIYRLHLGNSFTAKRFGPESKVIQMKFKLIDFFFQKTLNGW